MRINLFISNHIIKRNQQGGTLISVIAVMLIVGVLGVSVISFTQTSEHSYLSANAGSRAYYLAESGLRYAQQIYCSEGWLHGRQRTLSLQGGEQVDVVRVGGNFWATALVDAGTAQEARARVPMPLSLCGEDPDADPVDEFAVFAKNAVSIGTNTVIQGDIAITDDDIDIKGNVDGSVLANDVALTAKGTVSGDIYAAGEVDITGGTITGDIHGADGISVTSAGSIVEGWLFSNGTINIGGGAIIRGHIHACGADVYIGGNGTIIGTEANPIEIRTTGSVYLSGSAVVTGVVYAGAAIQMTGSAMIDGDAYAGGAIIKGTNNSITGTAWQFSPTYLEKPVCPDLANLEDLKLPDATVFKAGGSTINVRSGTSKVPTRHVLPPGTYGSLTSPNNPQGYTRLYLNAGSSGHGNYYFNTVSFGSKTALYLNLSGTYDIRIFVVGDVAIQSGLTVFVSTDGTTYLPMADAAIDPQVAARVYWESLGSFNLGSESKWFGSVYTPSKNLSVGNTSYLIGSYYSGGEHNIVGSTVVHVAPNYFAKD
jgi:cytoskeletal protein CcmA (bactofilin family)